MYATLPGRDGVITAVRFISESSVVTGDDTGTLALWSGTQGKACVLSVGLIPNLTNILYDSGLCF